MPQLDQGAFIALAFIALIGLMLILATLRYKTVEDVLKLWGGLGSIATAIATFYFTNNMAQKRVDASERDKQTAVDQLRNTQQQFAQLSQKLVDREPQVQPASNTYDPSFLTDGWVWDKKKTKLIRLSPVDPNTPVLDPGE